jgi:2,5-diketo-D-gluconate reductase A
MMQSEGQRSRTIDTQVPSVTLNNGVGMPILGFGVFQIPPDETEQAVATALEVGYPRGADGSVGQLRRGPQQPLR